MIPKPTDLRINNILIDARSGTLLKVESLSVNSIYFTFVDKDLREPLTGGWQAAGIVLTADVLEDCGFERNIWLDGDITIYEGWKKDGILLDSSFCLDNTDNRYKPVIYLHSLMNLFFDLTGEELQYTPS